MPTEGKAAAIYQLLSQRTALPVDKMQVIIADSSVLVKWLNDENEERLEEAAEILKDARDDKIVIFVPQLSRYEIGNALLKKKLKISHAYDTLTSSYELPVDFILETEKLAHETYRIALNNRLTYYDASFIALAKQFDATLVTDNPKHQAKVKGVKVIALKDYK